uniref:Odorant receptor n=1 Tax=Lutzomyia longipalpis TaxID=7200 RepID=A0A3F2ZDI0_LUTLO
MVELQSKVEFLRITKFINFSIRFITIDCGLISKTAGKFTSLLYIFINVYLTVNRIFLSMEEENILELCTGICTTIGLGIFFTKTFTICYYEEEIVELFKWIENFYLDNSEPILTKLKAESLEKTLWILKLFFKYYITFTTLVITYVNFFYLMNDIQMINLPGVSKTTTVYLQIILYFSYILLFDIPVLCFGCLGIIFIGILKYFNESIALLENTEEESLDDGFILVLYKLHCEIYEKFCIYENIFSFSVFFDFFFNTTSIIGVMLIIRLYPYLNIFHVVLATLVSQLLIYCIFGELIFNETQKISLNLYLTKWYDLNRENKHALLLMMVMSSRPFGLKAAGMYNINIIVFVQIMKLCFSYCAIIYAFL